MPTAALFNCLETDLAVGVARIQGNSARSRADGDARARHPGESMRDDLGRGDSKLEGLCGERL